MKDKTKHLYYLEELSDYKVASNYTDVRGWSVKDSDNRVVGKVDNLLVNKDIERVVYLDVEVDSTIIEANHDPYGKPENTEVHEFVNKEGENHIIIPIGLIDINEDRKFVYTNTINHQTFAETKRISTGANVNRQYEETVLQSYRRDNDPDKEAKASSSNEKTTSKQADTLKVEEEKLEKERQNLKDERNKLREERKKLEQERLSLEEERQRNDPEFWSNKKRETVTSSDKDYENNPDNDNPDSDNPPKPSPEDLYEDDPFYDRDEFDGSNYRNKK